MKASKEDKNFLIQVSNANAGDEIITDDNTLLVEHVFDVPTHFTFHQRIFSPGKILKVTGNSNIRIHIPADKISMTVKETADGFYDDKQKDADGKILPADNGFLRNPIKAKKLMNRKTK